MALRTAAMGLSPAKNLCAVSFSICWLSLSPNCMVVSSRLSTTPLKHRGTEEAEAERNCQNRRNCQRLPKFKSLLLEVLRTTQMSLASDVHPQFLFPPLPPFLRVSKVLTFASCQSLMALQ